MDDIYLRGSSMNNKEIETMRKSFKTVHDRKKQLLGTSALKDLQKKVKNIRKEAIENNEKLLKIAKNNLKHNDIEYYYAEDDKKVNDIILEIIHREYDLNNNFSDTLKSKSEIQNKNDFNNNDTDIVIAKSKSNTLSEINISNFLKSKNIFVIETDLGDRILQLKKVENKPSHPTGPASHLNVFQISKIISDSLGIDVDENPKDIMEIVKKDILEKLTNCRIGISGANSIAAEEGSVVLIHNEGNISLISLMKIHIVVAGIDKIVPTIEDAISIAKLETAYATGNLTTSYMNVISGPSKTADIEKKILKNMYGAEKVIVIILDNGRSLAIDECLHCIGCGSCIITCPVYNAVGNEFGFNNYLGGRGVAMSNFIEDEETSFKSGLYMCTLCGLCTFNCPVAMPTNELIEKIRSNSQKHGFYPKNHENIRKNIKNRGSPY